MKNNTNELNKALYTLISAKCANCFYGNVPKTTTYPYAIFSNQQISTLNGKTQNRLEINIFSKSQSEVETKADDLEQVFDHLDYMDNKVAFTAYRSQRIEVDEEDKTTKRIRLTIEMYSYMREE